MHGNQRQQRGGASGHYQTDRFNGDGQGGFRQDRAPLQWDPVQKFQEDRVVGVVTRAQGTHGPLFSFETWKADARDPEKKRRHYDQRDLGALRNVLSQIETYIAQADAA